MELQDISLSIILYEYQEMRGLLSVRMYQSKIDPYVTVTACHSFRHPKCFRCCVPWVECRENFAN